MAEQLKFTLRTVCNPGPPQQVVCPCCTFWMLDELRMLGNRYA